MQEHDCSLTREIVELIDREADLLVRGMKDETLQGGTYWYRNSHYLRSQNFCATNFHVTIIIFLLIIIKHVHIFAIILKLV